jgi:hypothetical protein
LAVGPLENALSVHHIALPASTITPAVFPDKSALSLEEVIKEFAFVMAAVWPVEPSLSLAASRKYSNEVGAVRPILFALSLLEIIDPVSPVEDSLVVTVLSFSMGLTASPLATVVIPIRMDVQSLAFKAAFNKLSIVVCSSFYVELTQSLSLSFLFSSPIVAH